MSKQKQRKSGGDKKHGRNKRMVDSATSSYVRGKIPYESYAKQKGIKMKSH
jgi:hypothetical protein